MDGKDVKIKQDVQTINIKQKSKRRHVSESHMEVYNFVIG